MIKSGNLTIKLPFLTVFSFYTRVVDMPLFIGIPIIKGYLLYITKTFLKRYLLITFLDNCKDPESVVGKAPRYF